MRRARRGASVLRRPAPVAASEVRVIVPSPHSPSKTGVNALMVGERLSELSSCKCVAFARLSSSCVEANEEFSGQGDTDDHFFLSSFDELLVEGGQARIVSTRNIGDHEDARSNAGASGTDMSLSDPGAAVVGKWRQASQLGNRLVGIDADLRQLSQQSCHGTVGDAFGAQRLVKARP